MASDDKNADQLNLNPPSSSSPSNLSSFASDPWKQRILIPTLLAGISSSRSHFFFVNWFCWETESDFDFSCTQLGISGAAVGSISKHRKVHGLSAISTTYATNFAIVTGCYCGNYKFILLVIYTWIFFVLSLLIVGNVFDICSKLWIVKPFPFLLMPCIYVSVDVVVITKFCHNVRIRYCSVDFFHRYWVDKENGCLMVQSLIIWKCKNSCYYLRTPCLDYEWWSYVQLLTIFDDHIFLYRIIIQLSFCIESFIQYAARW